MKLNEVQVSIFIDSGRRVLLTGLVSDDCPGLAITPGLGGIARFAITHVPTGCCMILCATRKGAEYALAAFAKLGNWNNERPSDALVRRAIKWCGGAMANGPDKFTIDTGGKPLIVPKPRAARKKKT
jgi:hypothetical protein